MNPVIIFHPDERNRAHLIDKDAVIPLPLNGTGKRLLHYPTCIAIDSLDGGEFSLERFNEESAVTKAPPSKAIIGLWLAGMALPRPSVYVPLTPREHIEETSGHRLIEPRAAVVLLKLAQSFNNVEIRQVSTWKFKPAAVEGEEIPWSDWRFLTAWLWSEWNRRAKKPTLAERFAEVEALGYDRGLKSFETMHRQMFPKISR
jgi:hypothetical protein